MLNLQRTVIWSALLLAVAVLILAAVFKGNHRISSYHILAVVVLNLIPVKHWIYKGLINIGILPVLIALIIITNV